MLAASEQLETDQLDNFAMVGELALTGGVRAVQGVLPLALRARAEGRVGVLVPTENAAEAAVVSGLQVIPIQNLPAARRGCSRMNTTGCASQRFHLGVP
jgi:magnesium chelatase family protein